MFCLWCLVVTASVLGTLGTHTTSTDAGNLVPNASLLFAAPPSATLALYKICWSSSGCAYMVAAFDATIHEDIDVEEILIMFKIQDSMLRGAFLAMRKMALAGNDGPNIGTVTNTAPWIVTIATSGIERAFKSILQFAFSMGLMQPKTQKDKEEAGQAKPMSRRVNNEAEFVYGSGQLNPRSVSPGLAYDVDDFVCSLINSRSGCYNYPAAMQFGLESNKGIRVRFFRRRVTNVDPAPTIYSATIRSRKGVEITVKPTSLIFSKNLQKMSFKVQSSCDCESHIYCKFLIWRSPRHIVRGPIVFNNP
ncbi:Subtilisin-like protease SBT4.14 [Glycine soja]